jgi:hypothetical protein
VPPVARPLRFLLRPPGSILVASALLLLFGYTLCRRGIVMSDEGYLLLQAVDLLGGKQLYRDMDSFVAPGVWLLLAGWFALVEPSVIASRWLALGGFLATAAVVHRCALRLSGRGAAAGAVAALAVFAVWAFPAWTFSFYSPYAVLFSLLALERLLAWRVSQRRRDLVLCGVALGLAGIFKQNYGVLAAAGCLLGWLAIRSEARGPALPAARSAPGELLALAAGMAGVGLPLIAWLVAVGAFDAAFDSLVLQPFRGFLGQHDIAYLPLSELIEKRKLAGSGRLTYGAWAFTHTALRFDWPRPLVRGIEALHVLLYWLPPAFLCAGAALALRARDEKRRFDGGLLAATAVAACVFLGVFPRADFNHLVNVLQPSILVAAVVSARVLARARRRPRGAFAAATAAGAAALGIYAAVAGYWYVDLLRTLTAELPQRRGGVLVSPLEQQLLDFEIATIRAATRPDEAVLTIPAGAMLNFLAERPMPSRYYNLYAVHIARDQGAGVVAGAREAGVGLVVTDYDDFFSERARLREYAPRLADYVRREFEIAFTLASESQLFLRRRATPLPERASLDALADCDAGASSDEPRSVRDHLLFRSLHHRLAPGTPGQTQERVTRCRVRVPADATLALQIGYRQPLRIDRKAQLSAEIEVSEAGATPEAGAALLRTPIPLGPARSWSSPPGPQFRLDLSRWAGREVELVLRTRFQGRAEMHELDFAGFAMLWQDPRIEYDAARAE